MIGNANTKASNMIQENDFLTFAYKGKNRHGRVERIRTIGERILFTISYSENHWSNDGDGWATEYRTMYLDQCQNVRKSCMEEYLENIT